MYNITKHYNIKQAGGFFCSRKMARNKKTQYSTGVPKTNVFMTKDLGIIAVIVMLAMED